MRSRSLRLLWTARTVSILGDSLSLVALMLYVADTTGRALAVAFLLLAGDMETFRAQRAVDDSDMSPCRGAGPSPEETRPR